MWHFISCLQLQKQSSAKEIITGDPSVYTMDHPKFNTSNKRKNSLVHKGLKLQCSPAHLIELISIQINGIGKRFHNSLTLSNYFFLIFFAKKDHR